MLGNGSTTSVCWHNCFSGKLILVLVLEILVLINLGKNGWIILCLILRIIFSSLINARMGKRQEGVNQRDERPWFALSCHGGCYSLRFSLFVTLIVGVWLYFSSLGSYKELALVWFLLDEWNG